MPDVNFWQNRFHELGVHSVGPGDTQSEAELKAHKQIFLDGIHGYLPQLRGPVLDFGCGVGRWVNDLPRPYLGLDLTPEHIDFCREKFKERPGVAFQLSEQLNALPDSSFSTIFTMTVLQHIVEKNVRKEILKQFSRLLMNDGVFFAVEWSEGQREFDWCTALKTNEINRLFKPVKKGIITEEGRKHTVWACSKRKRLLNIF